MNRRTNRRAVLEGLKQVEASRCDCASVPGLQTPGHVFVHGPDCWKGHTSAAIQSHLAATETRPDMTDRDEDEVQGGTAAYPSVVTRAGNLLHVYKATDDSWCVWLNTEVTEFDGLCIAVAGSRQDAIAHAVEALEAATDHLQGPPW